MPQLTEFLSGTNYHLEQASKQPDTNNNMRVYLDLCKNFGVGM